jgi:hypothetical protein
MQPASSEALDSLVSFVKGDTWEGLPSITVNNRLAPGNLSKVKMAFKLDPRILVPVLELTQDNGGISIIDAVNWVFSVNPGRYPLAVGKYYWQIETADDGDPAYVQTLLAGTGQVLADHTSITP